MEQLIADHLSDSRQGLNTQFRVGDLLRQSVYSLLAGYEDLNDAHTRYYWLLLAESHLTRRLFGSMLQRIWTLPVPTG